MKLINYLFSIGLIISSCSDILGQSIWTIKDPNGGDVIIDHDSSFLATYNGYLLFYTVNSSSGNRNILMANGDTSFWVLNEDVPLTSDFTSFIFGKNDELIFRVGDVWYSSYGGAETTQIFYNNADINNDFQYLNIFESQTSSNNNDLLIEAIERTTGDTVTLLHSYLSGATMPYAKKLRIFKGNIMGVGSFSGEYFINSIFDDVNNEWSDVGFHRQTIAGFTMLLPLGVKDTYNVNTIYYSGKQWIIDHLDNGERLVYSYRSNLDSCIAVTETEFPNYKVLDVINPIWPAWGPLFPVNNEFTIDDIVWKGRNQNGSVRYFLRSLFEQEFEIVDLRNDDDVDFMFSQFHDDSIYYYNHSDTQKGLVRTNFVNGISVKESTSIPFDSDYTIQAYNGNMYFGRYNSQAGAIQAMSKDFINDNKYAFLESTSGKRIENPINFSFLDDRIFVHSKTTEGVKLVVFDPDGIVSVDPIVKQSTNFTVAPNPSNGIFRIQSKVDGILTLDQDYIIADELGAIVRKGKVVSPEFEVDLTGLSIGTYFISISANGTIIYNRSLVLSGQ